MGDKYSEKTKEKMDTESLTLVQEAYREAYSSLEYYKKQVAQIAKMLIDNETVKGDVILKVIMNNSTVVIDGKNA